MTGRARVGVVVLGLALVAVGALGVTGVVRIPYLTPAAPADVEGDRPGELVGSDAGPGRDLVASGASANGKRKSEAEAALAAATEPSLPSEAKGTAIGKSGGTIRGRVVEGESKRPVAGARVELFMPEALLHYLRASPVGRYDRLAVDTDAEGRFVLLDVLAHTDYALRARRAKGPYATKPGLELAAREVLDVGDLVLGPAGSATGHVLGADGKGIADVHVAVTWKIENDFDAVMADPDTLPWVETDVRTDAEGAWKADGLEPGEKTIVFKAPSGAADVRSPVVVPLGGVLSGVDVTLGGSLPIAGRVEWADGKPIEGARVFAKTMKKMASFTVESGADGAFRLTGLAEGMYFVGAFVPGMSVQLLPGKKAGDENVRIVVPLAGALSGRVVSKSTGSPIHQYRMTPVFIGEADWMQKFVAQKIDRVLGGAGFQSPDGAFRFDRLKPGRYTLHVEAEGYPPTDSPPVDVVAGAEAKAAAVELADGHHIAGVVKDAAGAPIEGAHVAVESPDDANGFGDGSGVVVVGWEDRDGPADDARSDAHGAFVTPPLTPRAYKVIASAKGFVPRELEKVDVSGKSVEGVEIRLDRAGAFEVHVRDARGRDVPGVTLMLCDADGAIRYVQSGAQGRVVREDARPGRWAASELRQSIARMYDEAHSDEAHWDGAAFFERFCAQPDVQAFAVEVGARVERTIVVAARAHVEGRVRLGSMRLPYRWFFLRPEGSTDDDRDNWIGYAEDGAFSDDSVVVGRYAIFRPPAVGAADRRPVEVGALEVGEAGVKGVEIDLSK